MSEPIKELAAARPLALRCRLGWHDWRIISVNLLGHQSYRCRRCDRCFDHGRLFIQRQERGYYGGDIGAPWVTETDERGQIIDGRFVVPRDTDKPVAACGGPA